MRWQVTMAIAGLWLALVGPAQACGIDGVPSLSANGALAHINTARPSRQNLAHWAQFVFTASFHGGQTLRFSENLAEVRRTLLPQAFGKPWRWSFGDGSTSTGYTVQHAYKRAGEYKLIVSAYFSDYKTWYQFDDALVHIQ